MNVHFVDFYRIFTSSFTTESSYPSYNYTCEIIYLQDDIILYVVGCSHIHIRVEKSNTGKFIQIIIKFC